MAKKESTFLNMVLTMLIVTAVASIALAYVYKLTKEPIEEARKKKLQESINIVVPGADKAEITETVVDAFDNSGQLNIYTVTSEGKVIGTAIRTFSSNAFGGEMIVMVGFDEDGNIIDSNVLQHKETPGLGDKTDKNVSNWNSQFIGKNPSTNNISVKKDGGEIDAITAATISSRAYIDAIQRAHNTFMIHKGVDKKDIEDSNTGSTTSNSN